VAQRPRVVIVGGGFGGLYAAKSCRGVPVDVTLIAKRLFEKSFIGGISAVHYGHDCNTIPYRPH
jgi:cation diffusion facilitator CzcD-associated flavoprotein CzcO